MAVFHGADRCDVAATKLWWVAGPKSMGIYFSGIEGCTYAVEEFMSLFTKVALHAK